MRFDITDADALYAPEVRELALRVCEVLKGSTLKNAAQALRHVERLIGVEEHKAFKTTLFDGAMLPMLLSRHDAAPPCGGS